MNKLTYMVLGCIVIVTSIILMITNYHAFTNIPVNLSGNDPWELYFPIGTVVMLILGIFYLLFAFGRYQINKKSDRSVKFSIASLIIGFGGFFGIMLWIVAANMDMMGMILTIPFLIASAVLLVIAFVYVLMAKFKK